MFLIKGFQGDEANKRCHERVCLVTNTQRAEAGCRSQVSARAGLLLCVCAAVALTTEGPAAASACPSGETSDKWTGIPYIFRILCVMLDIKVNLEKQH